MTKHIKPDDELFSKLEAVLAEYGGPDFQVSQAELANFMVTRLVAHLHRDRAGEPIQCHDPQFCFSETAGRIARGFQMLADAAALTSTDTQH